MSWVGAPSHQRAAPEQGFALTLRLQAKDHRKLSGHTGLGSQKCNPGRMLCRHRNGCIYTGAEKRMRTPSGHTGLWTQRCNPAGCRADAEMGAYIVIRAFSDFKAFLYILIGGFSVRGCYHIKTPNFPLPCGRGPTSLPS